MEKAKTLLLLGGSEAQLIAIKKARELGYRTVLCDYLPDNPGQHFVDSFHLVSTTDREAVLEVAKQEGIDGIVAYGSDPAAPTAAYVSEMLGLPGVPNKVAQAFCNKHLFRAFLEENGFATPWSMSTSVDADASDVVAAIPRYPVIIKPTDSSGSKGVTVVEDAQGVIAALTSAAKISRNGVLVIEEFVVRDHPHVIEAEIFVVEGQVVSWGLMNSVRDESSNGLLPAGYCMPLLQEPAREQLVRQEVQRLVSATGVQYGAFNIEMIIDVSNRLFFLDAGPRNGGNMLPEFIGMASGKDVVETTLRCAVGDTANLDVAFDGKTGYWGLVVLHSVEDGSFAGVKYSPEAAKALRRECIGVEEGASIRRFAVCNDLVGLSFFEFESHDAMSAVMEHLQDHITILVS